MSLKSTIRQVLPSWAMDGLRQGRKRYRSYRWRMQARTASEPAVTEERLIADLRALGLKPGQDVIVHGSLSKLGVVEGGPATVIRALRAVLGTEGNLLMPVYPMKTTMYEHMRDPKPFDMRTDRSTMGAVTEIFRQQPRVLRSGHPTHSVAAEGPAARDFTERHHLSRSPCGPGSPFRLLSERGGMILCLGTGIGKVTSQHTIEDLVEDYPFPVYLPEPMVKTVIFPDGHEEGVEVLVHDPALTPKRVDNCVPVTREIHDDMRRAGIVREGLVGRAEAQLFAAADLDALHRERLKHGKTIYAV